MVPPGVSPPSAKPWQGHRFLADTPRFRPGCPPQNRGRAIVFSAWANQCGKRGQVVRLAQRSRVKAEYPAVWARLRQDLAEREQEDLSLGRVLTTTQFKQRVAQLLSGYGEPADGEELSYLSKLVRGMPKRLAKCRARKYGRCGK